MFKIGDHIFENEEAFKELLKSRLVCEYDMSVKLREEHDKKMEFIDDKRIKVSAEERWLYVKELLVNHTKKKLRPLKEGEVIINPWRS